MLKGVAICLNSKLFYAAQTLETTSVPVPGFLTRLTAHLMIVAWPSIILGPNILPLPAGESGACFRNARPANNVELASDARLYQIVHSHGQECCIFTTQEKYFR
jgi:hypothetical protein